ncbi:hypothetical protein DO021_20945 [Desulfobacter hydrogenophilus]|uniref:Uncharacterized protein n=1 Tax=Desulfobacter hydrogenophilus TaxID=2291 RepID=A0A328FAN7_9BACT|nr:hypothetical protein DO021_20945 [Desulfobacter hydrogenophilus]
MFKIYKNLVKEGSWQCSKKCLIVEKQVEKMLKIFKQHHPGILERKSGVMSSSIKWIVSIGLQKAKNERTDPFKT